MADRSLLEGGDSAYLSGILEQFPEKKDAVDEWFQTMESINIGLGFTDTVMKRTLIDKLGVKRYLQVLGCYNAPQYVSLFIPLFFCISLFLFVLLLLSRNSRNRWDSAGS